MDTELLAQHRAGDESAFADIVQRHTPWIYSLALRGCGDAHLAEDVVQAVFILLHRKAPHFVGDGAMINWLHKVARYAAATAARSERRRRKRQTEAALMLPQGNSSEWNELAPLLDQWIDRLPRADRQAVLLRYYLDLNFEEVGKQTDCSAEAARKRVDRAVEKLRGMAERKGLVLTSTALTTTLIEQIRVSPPTGLVARAVTHPSAGSSLAVSSQSIVKGTSFIMATTKAATFTASALAMMAVLGGAIWIAKAASVPSDANKPAARMDVGARGYAELAPFSAISWHPQVRVRGNWYGLTAINDISVDQIVNFIRKTYGDREVQKRFDQDLVEVLTRMGHPPGQTVQLIVTVFTDNGAPIPRVLADVPMSHANRQEIMAAEPKQIQ